MQEVHKLLDHLIQELKKKIDPDFNAFQNSIDELNKHVQDLNERTKDSYTKINSYSIQDLIDENVLNEYKDIISKSCTRTISRDIIKRKTITNEITYEIEKPLSSYSHIELLRESIANIKKIDSQPQILKEVFNFCTSITDKLFLFLERRPNSCFIGYDGYMRDCSANDAKNLVKKIKLPFNSNNVLMKVYNEKVPYIGNISDDDIDFFKELSFNENEPISIYPMFLKGIVVAILVFDDNIWKYSHLLDALMIVAELKMELTFAKRKVEPHYPPLNIEEYLEADKRYEKRTILNQERFEKDEPIEYIEHVQKPESPEGSSSEEAVQVPSESVVEGDPDIEFSEEIVEDEALDEAETDELPIEETEEQFEEKGIEETSPADSHEDEDEYEYEDEDEGMNEEEEINEVSFQEDDEIQAEEETEGTGEIEEEEEIERETEKIYIADIVNGDEEADEALNEGGDTFHEEDDELQSDAKVKTDEFPTAQEDEFDDDEIKEDEFDDYEDEDIIEEEEGAVNAEWVEDSNAEEDGEFSEDDMDFDEDDIEGELDEDIGSIPEELKEQTKETGAEPAEKVLSEKEEQLHNEARTFARLVVKEIKLYHEDKVKQGRINKNIYQLCKTDIDRGRTLYDQRASDIVKKDRDYYHEALIDILAAGDEDALGL